MAAAKLIVKFQFGDDIRRVRVDKLSLDSLLQTAQDAYGARLEAGFGFQFQASSGEVTTLTHDNFESFAREQEGVGGAIRLLVLPGAAPSGPRPAAALERPPAEPALAEQPEPACAAAQSLREHAGVKCGCCAAAPIRGRRWKCLDCEYCDLCDTCYPRREELHVPGHRFVELVATVVASHSSSPAAVRGSVGAPAEPSAAAPAATALEAVAATAAAAAAAAAGTLPLGRSAASSSSSSSLSSEDWKKAAKHERKLAKELAKAAEKVETRTAKQIRKEERQEWKQQRRVERHERRAERREKRASRRAGEPAAVAPVAPVALGLAMALPEPSAPPAEALHEATAEATAEALEQLRDMGFEDEELLVSLLQAHGNSVTRVLELLTEDTEQ